MGGRGWAGWSGVGGEWDNCNSIINKYIFFKKEVFCYEQPQSIIKEEQKLEPLVGDHSPAVVTLGK